MTCISPVHAAIPVRSRPPESTTPAHVHTREPVSPRNRDGDRAARAPARGPALHCAHAGSTNRPRPAHSRACSTAARSRDASAAEHEGGDKRARGTMRAGHMPRQSAPHAPRSLYLWARLDSPPAAATHAARSPRSTLAGCSLLPRCRQCDASSNS